MHAFSTYTGLNKNPSKDIKRLSQPDLDCRGRGGDVAFLKRLTYYFPHLPAPDCVSETDKKGRMNQTPYYSGINVNISCSKKKGAFNLCRGVKTEPWRGCCSLLIPFSDNTPITAFHGTFHCCYINVDISCPFRPSGQRGEICGIQRYD